MGVTRLINSAGSISSPSFPVSGVEIAKAANPTNLQIECFDDADGVCNNLSKFVADDDIILVKGSRSMHLETVVEKLKSFE